MKRLVDKHQQHTVFCRETLKRHLDSLAVRRTKLHHVDTKYIVDRVQEGLYDDMNTAQVDELAQDVAAAAVVRHPDYGTMAARIVVRRLHKHTHESFSDCIRDYAGAEGCARISRSFLAFVERYKGVIDKRINHELDYDYTYFGIKTLLQSYLLRDQNGVIYERPQHMIMRTAIQIHHHDDDLDSIEQTYDYMSRGYFTHASPTLFGSGLRKPQLSSCFLLPVGDSIDSIYTTLKETAILSKYSGGIGLSFHDVRSTGSYIKETGGHSNGLVPLLKVFNSSACYVDQGGGKRPGAVACYLEPWHADIESFIKLKSPRGAEEQRARDLFYALWVPDLFMERVKNDETWSLMCPHACPGLADAYGEQFRTLYTRYERDGKVVKRMRAVELMILLIQSIFETGGPYILFKDACNYKSNQKHLGTIRSGNLCAEIVQYASLDETAACVLASLALPRFVEEDGGGGRRFNWTKLKNVTAHLTRNLNKIIDTQYLPTEKASKNNRRHRPIGIGVQGLADTFFKLRLPFESEEAKTLNSQIFESIYHAALEASSAIARERGCCYDTYEESPSSRGQLQFDLWRQQDDTIQLPDDSLNDWTGLKQVIAKYGLMNSLVTAVMPTASTAQILGNTESIEPVTSNLYVRRVLSGEFQVVNRYMVEDLVALNVWNEDTRNRIISNNGSIQEIAGIPNAIKAIYKTVWEIPQKTILKMARDRGIYIDQSQSMNVYFAQPTQSLVYSMLMTAWEMGLKTGMYYLRSKPVNSPIKPTNAAPPECIACNG